MTAIAMPEIDQRAIARREAIVAGLAAIVGADAVITEEDGRRAYETDALTAYRAVPLAVVGVVAAIRITAGWISDSNWDAITT